MNVEKFLEDLKFLLSDLPEEERDEALEFYKCYFEDAGPENEASIIEELGSPEKVAYSIREGLKNKDDEGEYTETGYRTYDDISAPATRNAHKENNQENTKSGSAEENYKKKYAKPGKEEGKQNQTAYKKPEQQSAKVKKDSKVPAPLRIIGEILLGILKVLMVIATICIVILLICALIALIVCVVASLGVTMGFLIVGIGNLATGAGLIGVALIGISFIAFAIFLLLLIALVAFCKKGLAEGIRGITSTAGKVVNGRKKKEA